MSPAVRQLSTAAERREVLVETAVAAFAERGYHGTPTTEIARAAGISQAYLFRLFPTKSALYVAAVDRCYTRLGDTLRAAAEGAQGEAALEAMGRAYRVLLADRTTLSAMLQGFAAAAGDDEEIRDAVRRGYADLYAMAKRLSGADAERLRTFFARGMLMIVLAGMDAGAVDADWAYGLLEVDEAYR